MCAGTEPLPHLDEHSLVIEAPAARVWDALLAVFERSLGPGSARRFAAVLGCADTEAAGPRPLAEGSTFPGFHVAAAVEPRELALAGSHRFSRYELILRLDDLGERTRLRAETRAEFPGAKGGAYRALVIGTGLHVLATRRILAAVKTRAERG